MHQRRLAGAVVPDQPDTFAGADMEVDAVERADGAEMFFGAVQPDDICNSLKHPQRYPVGDAAGNVRAAIA